MLLKVFKSEIKLGVSIVFIEYFKHVKLTNVLIWLLFEKKRKHDKFDQLNI